MCKFLPNRILNNIHEVNSLILGLYSLSYTFINSFRILLEFFSAGCYIVISNFPILFSAGLVLISAWLLICLGHLHSIVWLRSTTLLFVFHLSHLFFGYWIFTIAFNLHDWLISYNSLFFVLVAAVAFATYFFYLSQSTFK